jgi:hypothetical protein
MICYHFHLCDHAGDNLAFVFFFFLNRHNTI